MLWFLHLISYISQKHKSEEFKTEILYFNKLIVYVCTYNDTYVVCFRFLL